MSRTVTIKVHFRVHDDITDEEAASSAFDTLAQYAEDEVFESVDGWDL